MVISYNWIKYDKEISTNQLILKNKDLRNYLIKLNRSIFKMKISKGHSSLFRIYEGNPEEIIERYKLFEINFRKLLNKNFIGEVNEMTSTEDLKKYESGRIIYSPIYNPEIHKFTQQNKLYYITLV